MNLYALWTRLAHRLACATELSRAGTAVIDKLGGVAVASSQCIIDAGGRAASIEADICDTAKLRAS